jgi:hypothetical protein
LKLQSQYVYCTSGDSLLRRLSIHRKYFNLSVSQNPNRNIKLYSLKTALFWAIISCILIFNNVSEEAKTSLKLDQEAHLKHRYQYVNLYGLISKEIRNFISKVVRNQNLAEHGRSLLHTECVSGKNIFRKPIIVYSRNSSVGMTTRPWLAKLFGGAYPNFL